MLWGDHLPVSQVYIFPVFKHSFPIRKECINILFELLLCFSTWRDIFHKMTPFNVCRGGINPLCIAYASLPASRFVRQSNPKNSCTGRSQSLSYTRSHFLPGRPPSQSHPPARPRKASTSPEGMHSWQRWDLPGPLQPVWSSGLRQSESVLGSRPKGLVGDIQRVVASRQQILLEFEALGLKR